MFRLLNNTRFSRPFSGMMAFIILFNNIIFPTSAFALTSGPGQPEYSSFDSVNASEMVNMFTGDFSYNIPLMDVDGYPINISYHASPGMDQEASWVGLGWNINSGAINRGMRGLPDDFNGEEIKREINMADFKAWGVGIGGGVEISGLDSPLKWNLAAGIGVTKSNYKGVGFDIFLEPSLVTSVGKSMQGSLTTGLGIKASSTDGMDIYPQLGISGQYKTMKSTASIGYNIGATYNSRAGAMAINNGISVSYARGKFNKNPHTSSSGKKFYRGSGIGYGVGSSASIPTSSQGYMPQMTGNMKSQSYSLDFKLGSNACVVAPFGYIRGYYAQNGLASKDIKLSGYGYMNSQNGDRQALHDFSREKDGMMYPETPNLPITNYSYDMFYASAQGLEMAFRPHRNDIGMVHDNPSTESSFGIGASGEVLITPDVNVGVNLNTHWSDGESGRWDSYNDMLTGAGFTSPSGDYEASYFKVAGEKTADDINFSNTIKNDKAVKVRLESVSNTTWRATDKIVDNTGGTGTTISANLKKSKRAVRNNLISYLNSVEASSAAIDKSINDYKPVYSNTFDNVTNSNGLTSLLNTNDILYPYGELKTTAINAIYNRLSYANNRTNHISELTVTNTNGGRFVYGLPVYNREQNEVMFNISNTGATQNHATATGGLINYTSTDASKGNQRGLDHFYEKNIVPAYANSYLLTEVLSSDYADRTNNGPSIDDYGDYTKFNYSYTGNYKWRIPYQSGKAIFNQGFLSDNQDDKASYLYGNKDTWMPHSIETKNFIAFFVMGDTPRKDAYGVGSETGGISGGATLPYLKEIRLYAKKNFGPNDMKTTLPTFQVDPIKVVHFEYDYSLCPGVPNNNQTTTVGSTVLETASGPSYGLPKNGKLTLKKIYFTQGNSNKGNLTPYTFKYCNGNYTNPADNPTYDPAAIDRWGSYKPNPAGANNNIDFPYATQNKATADVNARAWSLTEIKTPAGSKINVTYQADDYAYVQNVEAAQMFKILGASSSASGSPYGTTLYDNDYLVIDLAASGADGVTQGTANALDLVKQKFFKGRDKIYIKACVQLTATKYEFVPLYAEIDNISIVASATSNYYNAVVKIKRVGINDDNSNKQINPICKAAFQLGRMYVPGVVFPGSQPNGSDHQVVKGLTTLVQDMRSMFSGINRALYNRNVARSFDPARSVVKLFSPAGKKLGGGSRVEKIEMTDSWDTMSGEAPTTYGQMYSYETKENGMTISSGVASYEPLNGGDENSNRKPVEFSIKRVMAPNDEYFQEEPLGESFFPDALVGYSKVSVKSLERTNVKKHATGRTEYEFYTARDFPVIVERTTLQKQPVKPKLIRNLLKFGSTDKLYMSQGFAIKTNDMHGKPRAQKSFEENALAPISGINYYYRTKAGTTNQLDNEVSVIDPANNITNKTIGQTTDMITDSRSAVSNIWGAGVSVNVNSAACTFYVPLVFVWPSFSHEKKEFYSITTTKVINQYGLVDKVVAFDNSSNVETSNLLYDEETGEVVLTKTNNNFDDAVYAMNYPAYWAYEKMGHAYKNTGIRVNGSGVFNNSTSEVTGTYFVPGDEVLVKDQSGAYTKTWVIQDKVTSPNKNYLVKSDGAKFQYGSSASNLTLSITRSGKRNLLGSSMSQVTSLQNPVTANKINVTAATQVLSSSATEYSENWQTTVGDSRTTPTGQQVAYITYDPLKYSAMCNVVSAMFDHTLVYPYTNANPCNPGIYTTQLLNHYQCPPIQTTPTTYYSMWASPPYTPLPPNIFVDIVMGGLCYQENVTPQYAAPAFKQYMQLATSYGLPCHYLPNATGYLWFDRLKRNLSGINYDKLEINFEPQKGGVYPFDWASTNPNITPGSCYGNNGTLTQPTDEGHCGVSIFIPSSGSSTFKWQQVYSVGNFSLPNPILTSTNPNPDPIWAQAKFDCFAANGQSLGVGYIMQITPGIQDTYVNCLNGFMAQSVPGNQTLYCGKLLTNVINPYAENLKGNWLPKTSYSYLTNRSAGNIKSDGYYTSFKPFYDQQSSSAWLPVYNRSFNNNATVPYDNWQKGEETEYVNQKSQVLQTKNSLGLRSSVLYGYNNTLPVAAATNAGHNEIAFDSFEDYLYMTGQECGAMTVNNPNGYIGHFNYYYNGGILLPVNNLRLTTSAAHTGKYSMLIPKSTGTVQSKISLRRRLSKDAPVAYSATSDNVPYTLKEQDNSGTFGPYDRTAFGNTPRKYVLSVWVRELNVQQSTQSQVYGLPIITSPQVTDYGNLAKVNVYMETVSSSPGGTPTTLLLNTAAPKKSPVINSWQKLEYEFDVPDVNSSTDLGKRTLVIDLYNSSTTRTYLFDDIRVQPFNSQMKAMVYDPASLRLMAELDDRNFATTYEYDREGTLVRINKETEKGIYTLKETRSGLKK